MICSCSGDIALSARPGPASTARARTASNRMYAGYRHAPTRRKRGSPCKIVRSPMDAAVTEHPRLRRDVSVPLCLNTHLIRWVEKMANLTKPAAIHWVDGSQEENDLLCDQMVQSGTMIRLNQNLWPGCYYARSDANDVARVEDRTFICSL